MAQTGYSVLSLYYSSTASNVPTAGNLVAGELAINTADGKLFYKDSAGVVQVIGTKGGVGSSTTTQVLYNSSGLVVGSSNLIFNGTQLGVGRTPTTYAIEASGAVASYSGSNNFQLQASGNDGYINLTGTGNTIFRTGSGSLETMRIDASGNVGIGTSSPAAKLDVNGSAFTNFLKVSGGSGQATSAGLLDFSSGATRIISAGADASTYGQFIVYGANAGVADAKERMRIDASGRLLVGTTTAQGGIATFYSTTNTLWTNCNQAGAAALVVQNSGTGSGTSCQFTAFQAGTSSTNGTTVGTISYNGTLTIYATTSDERVKTDNGIATETSVIDNTVIHDFTWKNGVKDRGVFAQEAYKVKPSAVQVGTDEVDEQGNLTKPWGVDYSVYVPDLIVYCQQLKARIETLEAQLGAK